ncbi:hypothetical protein [Vibrio cholerae]|uniref:hypothetical protein n=1 Tax=Vibrio cholerae TaxID=666 RepID=UPI0030804F32
MKIAQNTFKNTTLFMVKSPSNETVTLEVSNASHFFHIQTDSCVFTSKDFQSLSLEKDRAISGDSLHFENGQASFTFSICKDDFEELWNNNLIQKTFQRNDNETEKLDYVREME